MDSSGVSTKILWAIIILIWLLAILITNNVYQHGAGELLKFYIDCIKYVIPLNTYASQSSFPDAARAYHSIIWWTFPMFSVVSYRYLVGLNGIFVKSRKELTIGSYLTMIFYGLFFIVFAYAGFFWNKGQNVRLVEFGTSIKQFLFFGLVWPGSVAFCFTTGVCFFRKIIFGKI